MGFEDPMGVDQDSRATVELAAGGLVWRGKGRRRRLAVVHRPKHGDWSLPKGRLGVGESLKAAAVREVREETGCEVEVRGFAGVTVHRAKGLPKIVFYWHMLAAGSGDRAADGRSAVAAGDGEQVEVDEIEWLTPPQAAKRLDHLEEQQLVVDPLSDRHPEEARWRRWLWWLLKNVHLERLRREVFILERQLPRRSHLVPKDPEGHQWFEELGQLTRAARCAADERRTEDGWAFLQAARQIEVLLYSPDEVENEGKVLLEEARDKLSGWRRAGVEKLLGEAPFDAGAVAHAMLIRDGNFANVYYRIDLERRQLRLLVPIALVSLLCLVELLTDIGFPVRWAQSLSLGSEVTAEDFSGVLLIAILLAGTLGASLSAVLDIARSSPGKIPEKLSNWTIALGRLGIGSAAALVVALFLVTGVGELQVGSVGALLFFSVVAGASERLVKRALATGG